MVAISILVGRPGITSRVSKATSSCANRRDLLTLTFYCCLITGFCSPALFPKISEQILWGKVRLWKRCRSNMFSLQPCYEFPLPPVVWTNVLWVTHNHAMDETLNKRKGLLLHSMVSCNPLASSWKTCMLYLKQVNMAAVSENPMGANGSQFTHPYPLEKIIFFPCCGKGIHREWGKKYLS